MIISICLNFNGAVMEENRQQRPAWCMAGGAGVIGVNLNPPGLHHTVITGIQFIGFQRLIPDTSWKT